MTSRPITIWHNPRCSKSRQTLRLLEDNHVTPQVVYYLRTPPTAPELDHVLTAMNMEPRQLMRIKDPLYQELDLDSPSLNRKELLDIMAKHPNLLERPVVISGPRAVLGRPPENVLALLS